MTNDISGRTLLVAVKIKIWSGDKRDKTITDEICELKEVSGRSVRANKSLLGTRIKPVHTAEGALRTYVNSRTLPWMDNGQRILKSTAFESFKAGLIKPIADFNDAVDEFVANYDQVKSEASANLGLAYNESDFPDVSTVRKRYGITMSYMPMPRSDDFRAALTQEELSNVRESCDDTLRTTVQDAIANAIDRMRTPIERMADKLKNFSRDSQGKAHGVFRDSLVDNLRDLVALVPTLNITDDPRIDAFCSEIRHHLTEHEADALRASPHLRTAVVSQADRILREMSNAFA